jgi:PAS domain S-box-containing protein
MINFFSTISKEHQEESVMTQQLILDTLPLAVIALKNRKITYANASVERIFGWEKKELLEKNVDVLYRSQQEYEEVGKNFYTKLEKQAMHRDVFPARHKDGRDIICDITVARIGDALSEEKDAIAIYDDITEKIEAEKELNKSEETYRAYIENTHDIIITMTPEGKILGGNKTCHTTFEYDEKEFEELTIFDLVYPEEKESFKEAFKNAISNHLANNINTPFLTKSGKKLYFDGNLVPRIFYGDVITVTGFYHNRTEEVSAQVEVARKIKEMEQINKMVIDRELKMVSLKHQIQELEQQLKNETIVS